MMNTGHVFALNRINPAIIINRLFLLIFELVQPETGFNPDLPPLNGI
jgi:hypothetical protein